MILEPQVTILERNDTYPQQDEGYIGTSRIRGEPSGTLFGKLIYGKRFMRRTVDGLIGLAEVPEPDTVCWIDPKRIEFHTNVQDVKLMRTEFHNVKNVNSIPFEDRVFNGKKVNRAGL